MVLVADLQSFSPQLKLNQSNEQMGLSNLGTFALTQLAMTGLKDPLSPRDSSPSTKLSFSQSRSVGSPTLLCWF